LVSAPIETRAAFKTIQDNSRQIQDPLPPPPGEVVVVETQDLKPPAPTLEPIAVTTLEDLRAWVAVAVPEIESIGGKLAALAATYPVDWVHLAILTALTNAKPGKLASYANGCLAKWRVEGGPNAAKPKSTPGVLALSPANQRRAERRAAHLALAPRNRGSNG